MSKTLDDIAVHNAAYRKAQLHELLDQCTEEQRAFFDRMYGSRDTIPEEKIDWAIQQCERTIVKNKASDKEDKGSDNTTDVRRKPD